ncbi:hypothetical protein HIM_07775 [Hirsutella minnesotensis 3608]|uniref:Uncharacterized protein n=1 Tax=Hirsutella minnesotensis 3608 TaxID=1043627 RepID=A0A0F7ZHL1_9HYPO|nr:hypothetical protein HIM_07775 [Hirsutella minnesotensis 3608]
MATEAPSPATKPAAGSSRGGRGGRGGRGRGGRGRGGGRGGKAGVAKTSSGKSTAGKTGSASQKQDASAGNNNTTGRPSNRRGRVKNFTDSRVQAAYDRQRDLKATYLTVANAVKPALQELADRTVDNLLDGDDVESQCPEIVRLNADLQEKYDVVVGKHDAHLQHNLDLAERRLRMKDEITQKSCEAHIDDLYEKYYDGLLNKLRLLSTLHDKNLPIDIRDDRFEYKVIDDDHLDYDFGPYEEYVDGMLVPYPHRVVGTRMWHLAQAREAEAQAEKEAAAAAKVKATKGKGIAKRKPLGQPEGQPTPKKTTRNSTKNAQLLPPAELSNPPAAKGLLAAAKEAAEETTDNTPVAEEDSVPTSPEANSPRNGNTDIPKAQRSPKLPRNVSEPDEFGVRSYHARTTDKVQHFRLRVPRTFLFEPHEIGFRDSTNDLSRHKVKVIHKYTNTPNSSALHIDHRMLSYDYSTLGPDDFDQDIVRKHKLHPRYGIFLPNSVNKQEEIRPYVMPGKPVVFIANPSGRISHTSRSFQDTTNQRSADEAPLRAQFTASMQAFCKKTQIGLEDIATTEYVDSEQDIRAKSLGTAQLELQASPFQSDATASVDEDGQQQDYVDLDPSAEADGEDDSDTPAATALEQPDGGMTAMSLLAYATAFAAAKEAPRSTQAVSKTSRYDAIRDVFTSSRSEPSPAPDENQLGLNFLAEVCDVEPRAPGSERQAEEMPPPSTSFMPEQISQHPMAYDAPSSVPLQGQISMNQNMGQPPPMQFMHEPSREPLHLPQAGAAAAHAMEQQAYSMVPQDMGMPPHHQQARPDEYPQHHHLPPQPPQSQPLGVGPPLGHPVPDQNPYYPPPGYPAPDPRDAHMAPGRSMDQSYSARPMAGYGSEAPPAPPQAYGNHMYWPQHQQPGPSPITAAAIPAQNQYPPPPAPPASTHPRIPFSHNASAEPLPPLRPPRSRAQSVHEESSLDPRMRPSMHGGHSSYYPPPPGPPRAFSRGYPEPPPHPASQSMGPDRVLPAPHHQPQQAYMGSPPPPGYATQVPQMLSPTFANPPPMAGQMVQQSPPGTPLDASGSALHRGPPSGDAANGKYRKLQPAPVPAHRVWNSKPELKTIFYDHKETGSSAALPNSGPTQIRGWNVNQSRKRSRHDNSAQPKAKAARRCVRFALPPAMPELRETKPHPRPGPRMVAAPMPPQPFDMSSLAMFGFGAIPTIESAVPETNQSDTRTAPSSADDGNRGRESSIVVVTSDAESERPLKKRLRPRKKQQ